MIKALATLTLGSLLVSAQYHIMCFEDSECEGFCMEGTCRPYIAQGQFCNLYRKCTSNSVCVDNSCIDNTCDADHHCDEAYCNQELRLCVPLKLMGDACDATTKCSRGLACKKSVCELKIGCVAASDCESGEYCDIGARTCHTQACTVDSQCSTGYFCHEDDGECARRPELGEACGGAPSVPCHSHLQCDPRTSVCVDPMYNQACEDLKDACDSCTDLGFRRCVWTDGQCQMGSTCDGLDGCVRVPTSCPATEDGPRITGDAMISGQCSRDLDCNPRKQFCYGGVPGTPASGTCEARAQDGQICGGHPQVECLKGFTCVVDGHHRDRGVCVGNDQKGITRVRGARRQEYEQEEEQEEEQAPAKPVAPSSSITASIDDTATSSIGNTATGSTGFYGAPLRTSQVGLYHPDSLLCRGCVDGVSGPTCPSPSACGFLPIVTVSAAPAAVAAAPFLATSQLVRGHSTPPFSYNPSVPRNAFSYPRAPSAPRTMYMAAPQQFRGRSSFGQSSGLVSRPAYGFNFRG